MQGPPDWWKKWKPLRWLAGGGVLIALASELAPRLSEVEILAPADAPPEQHFVVPAGVPVPFLDNFSSYDNLEKAREMLSAAGYTADFSRNRKPRSRKYPPRDLDTLTVGGYKHLGVTGRLELVFFNDNLYMAIFDVSKAGPYAEALNQAEPHLKRDKLGTAEYVDGNRRVLTNVYFTAGPVGRAAGSQGWAMWQDLKLVQLRNEWEVLYGLITP
ncbi:MAG: hypothetical protein AABY95_06510 [Pseudomonadota bacterium]